MKQQQGALTDIVDELEQASRNEDKVQVGNLIDALDHRGYGPALAVLRRALPRVLRADGQRVRRAGGQGHAIRC